jgi:hypothetical protein
MPSPSCLSLARRDYLCPVAVTHENELIPSLRKASAIETLPLEHLVAAAPAVWFAALLQ